MALTPQQFTDKLKEIISENRKIKHPLYEIIMKGEATPELLKNFVKHRYHIKNFWTRNVSAIHSKTPDLHARIELAENIFEEETGKLTGTKRHNDLFFELGSQFGLTREELDSMNLIQESQDVINWNIELCGPNYHFTSSFAGLILYMEAQPKIVYNGLVMKDAMEKYYNINKSGVEYYDIHMSNNMEVEDDHAEIAYEMLRKYATTEELQQAAFDALYKTIELRFRHFTAILRESGIAAETPVTVSVG